MLGMLRRHGWPRISPRQSRKARDLLRDDRCVLHGCTAGRNGAEATSSFTEGRYGLAWNPRTATRRWQQRSEWGARYRIHP